MAMEATPAVQHYDLLIDGKRVPAASGATFETVSPATNRPVGRVAKGDGGRRARGGRGAARV